MNHEHGVKFAGTVFARLKGTENWFDLGNTTSLTIATSNEKDERISHRKDTYGQALDSINTPKPPEIKWENDTFNKRNFAFMLMGEAKDVQTTAKKITDEVVKLKAGEWVKLANENLDPKQEFVLKTESGTAIKAEQYQVNHNLGMVMLTDESAEGNGKATYTLRAGESFVIDAAKLQGLQLELMIDGINRVTGENAILNVWETNVAAEGDFDWLSGDWGKSKFAGTCITPQGKESPYQLKGYAA